MNRRDFLTKSFIAGLAAKCFNPVCFAQESQTPVRTLYIFLRGGIDGHQAWHPIDEGVANFFQTIRPNLMLSGTGAPYTFRHILPIGPNRNGNSGIQFGFHPFWERLFSRNLLGTISNQSSDNIPQRVFCENVTVNGQSRPLDHFLAFRLMKGVGLMHHLSPTSTITAKRLDPDKSHFNQQTTAFVAFKNFAVQDGYLGKFVFFEDRNSQDLNIFKLAALGGFSQKELGGRAFLGNKSVPSLSSSFGELESLQELNLTFHSYACTSYRQANKRLLLTGSADASSTVLPNFTTYSRLLADKRKEGGLYDIFYSNLDLVPHVENTAKIIKEAIPNLTDQDKDLFAQWYYSHNSSNSRWSRVSRRDTFEARLMFEIARFFVANGLPEKRVAALSLGGYDTHANQNTVLQDLLTKLAGALHGLFCMILRHRADLMGCLNVIILTEFGRTLAQNSALSTDHGWANILAGIFGIPVNIVLSPSFVPGQYDRELGPRYIAGDISENIRAVDYARDVENLHLGVNRLHAFAKISMLSGLAKLLKAQFPSAPVEQFMEEEFYKKNFLTCRAEDQLCLWEEFLSGLPGR